MKFRENAWEFSTSCTGTLVPPQKNASNYVYFFLTRWKYITVFKSKYIIIFDFSEFKRKANTCEFHKKGRTSIPSLFYSFYLFVLFLLDVVLSVLPRFTDSDCHFGINKLFFRETQSKKIVKKKEFKVFGSMKTKWTKQVSQNGLNRLVKMD